MSYFDLSTDGKIPRDGLRKHVQTQIPTEGGAKSGLIRLREMQGGSPAKGGGASVEKLQIRICCTLC